MFNKASKFNGDVSKWDVSSVTDMFYMFFKAKKFNGDVFKWDVSSVTYMGYMFNKATKFNGDVSKWDVSSVISMEGMFNRAKKFNSDVSKWDVSSVDFMGYMFDRAKKFNSDVSNWDVSSVTYMGDMFYKATKFNSDVSNWDVSSVSNSVNKEVILFEDSMTDNWQEKWFLDGKKATVRTGEDGLYFAGGTVTKHQDPIAYHAHHAVLWTHQVFEGDIRIQYEMTRVDDSSYGTTLLYIQAQGIDTSPYDADIHAWKAIREIPAMSIYFKKMNLISLSFRKELRCKRYPRMDDTGKLYPRGGLVEPMQDYAGIETGKTYHVEVEKRAGSATLVLYNAHKKAVLLEATWDTTQVSDRLEPPLIKKGRIGLRHMSTRQFVYKNFTVERL